jgi:methionyl-tRNA synthetase
MMTAKRKILITCALPYANGPIHLGHMLEHIEADVYARAQRMSGHECIFICADDTHGTPIMIAARQKNISPEELIAKSFQDHVSDFQQFGISYNHYGSTHTEENKKLSELFFERMSNKNHIATRPVEQLYCEHDKMFLPDRFVKGTCPKCASQDQYGDSCDVCGATYGPGELKNPYCSICSNKPIKKSSDHIFFKLNEFKNYLAAWLPEHTATETSKKMMEWFKEDLRDWDISRDEPYFGFQIPLKNQKPTDPKKYFYVWVDAPMGYISGTEIWAKKNNRTLAEFWDQNAEAEVYHFIGKDIVYFHTLFWPALLKAADFRSPTAVNVHGHVMVNGEKMSKSKGTFLNASTYSKYLEPEFLRYYYSTKINGTIDDMDLNFDDFAKRVNSDLIGKIVNLASRGGQMLNKKYNSQMTVCDDTGAVLLQSLREKKLELISFYNRREFSKVTSTVRELTETVNKYFDEQAPWKTQDTEPEKTQRVLTTTLNAFRIIAIYLAPVLPKMAHATAELLNEKTYSQFDDVEITLKNQSIKTYSNLATRIEAEKIAAMIADQKSQFESIKPSAKPPTTAASAKSSGSAAGPVQEIEFEDFAKVDLRIAEIISAEEIKEADKLLRIKVSLGEGITKNIIAGIKSAYKAESLIGRKVLICANLKPRKMKFGLSEGMILAAGDGGSDLFVLAADDGAKTGSKVK